MIKSDGDMNDDESMATELDILRTVRHRYILNCIEIFEAQKCIWSAALANPRHPSSPARTAPPAARLPVLCCATLCCAML